jgi:uncharacterized membrane protein YciS (DUF1049 family)
MKNIINRASGLGLGLWVSLIVSVMSMQTALAAEGGGAPEAVVRNSMMAESPFSNYTAAVVAYVLLVGFLVSVLLIGGFLVLNLGLMSKRAEDRVGGRTPSDVGILKHTIWPQEEDDTPTLPAEESEDELARARVKRRKTTAA